MPQTAEGFSTTRTQTIPTQRKSVTSTSSELAIPYRIVPISNSDYNRPKGAMTAEILLIIVPGMAPYHVANKIPHGYVHPIILAIRWRVYMLEFESSRS